MQKKAWKKIYIYKYYTSTVSIMKMGLFPNYKLQITNYELRIIYKLQSTGLKYHHTSMGPIPDPFRGTFLGLIQ